MDNLMTLANDLLKNNKQYRDCIIKEVYINYNKEKDVVVVAQDEDDPDLLVQFNPYKENSFWEIPEWHFNLDEYDFERLEDGYTIAYISTDMHYNMWESIAEGKPEEWITNWGGFEKYLSYCKLNNITKETLTLQNELEVSKDIYKHSKRMNVGKYKIVNELEVGSSTYVLGFNETNPSPYATWHTDKRHMSYTSGNYFIDYHDAFEDLCERASTASKELQTQKYKVLNEKYMSVTVCGISALMSYGRIKLDTIPGGIHRYEMRHEDEDGTMPCHIQHNVMVNHYGTILSKKELPLGEEGFINIDDDNFIEHDKNTTLREYMKQPKTKSRDKQER